MKIEHRLIVALLVAATLVLSCKNGEDNIKIVEEFSLPANFVSKVIEISNGKGIKIQVTPGYISKLKDTSSIFHSWNKLEPGVVIVSNDFEISGDSGHHIEYSVGKWSGGVVQVLAYDHTTGELYLLYADMIM